MRTLFTKDQVDKLNDLIQLDHDAVQLYAKAEWKNPGGSVKDRPALRMIQEGIASGELTPGKTILDAITFTVLVRLEFFSIPGWSSNNYIQ